MTSADSRNLVIMHSYILSLFGACNNACVFCMEQDRISPDNYVSSQSVRIRVNSIEPGNTIRIYGGEPTMHPQFEDIVKHLYEKGLIIQLSTNGRRFSSSWLASEVGRYLNTVLVSLHGHTSDLHDRLTRREGSFYETVQGIRNLIAAGCRVQCNSVVVTDNVNYLYEIAKLVFDIGVNEIKFSSLVGNQSIADLLPPLDDIRNQLSRVIQLAVSLNKVVHIEKSPFCLAPGHMMYFVPDQHETGCKLPPCKNCVVSAACYGVHEQYSSVHRMRGIEPISKCHDKVISGLREYLSAHDLAEDHPWRRFLSQHEPLAIEYRQSDMPEDTEPHATELKLE